MNPKCRFGAQYCDCAELKVVSPEPGRWAVWINEPDGTFVGSTFPTAEDAATTAAKLSRENKGAVAKIVRLEPEQQITVGIGVMGDPAPA